MSVVERTSELVSSAPGGWTAKEIAKELQVPLQDVRFAVWKNKLQTRKDHLYPPDKLPPKEEIPVPETKPAPFPKQESETWAAYIHRVIRAEPGLPQVEYRNMTGYKDTTSVIRQLELKGLLTRGPAPEYVVAIASKDGADEPSIEAAKAVIEEQVRGFEKAMEKLKALEEQRDRLLKALAALEG